MRILGSTILDRRFGKKYRISQIINGDECELVFSSSLTEPDGLGRVKQILTENDECELVVTGVNNDDD